MKPALLILWICLVAACGQPGKSFSGDEALSPDSIRYAKGFRITSYDNYTVVELTDPWDSAALLQRYVLVERNRPLPDDLPRGTLLRTPLQNIAVYGSVHASIIDALGEINRVIGVCEPQYIDLPAVRRGLRDGRIADLGMATAPNVEKMLDTGVECIIASPFQNSGYGQAANLGIPIIEAADYMEAHPLGRAEWARFYGLLLGRADEADSIFRATEKRYLALRDLAQDAADRPTVITEKRYGAVWYVPCGDSYIAHFFRDAGADYLFAHIPGQGSAPLAFETVLDQAQYARFWLIKYNQESEMTLADLRSEYTPYERFDAFAKGNVYGCNTGATPYYEESLTHPDRLLEDLIHIFHPTLLPSSPTGYHTRLR
jgi:iron complex transport system substrate-binding protein